MPATYREELFASYHETHAAFAEEAPQAKMEWSKAYFAANYLPLLRDIDRAATVLEIGCGPGYMLRLLLDHGYSKVTGIDMSPADCTTARSRVPEAEVICGDAVQVLASSGKYFDVILLKAVLEHVPKSQVLTLLSAIESKLTPEGRVLIDVPNMDWFLAQHERYMDFTHEAGFTRESLGQLMRNVFTKVEIHAGKPVAPTTFKGRTAALFRPLLLRAISLVLKVLGEGAADTWWHCRSIVAVGVK